MSNIACKYCQTEREHDYDFAECCDGGHIEALEAERDELKAGRASFFDVHTKLQDRLSDAEFHLETSRQYAIGMSKNIAQLEAAHCEAMERAMADVERVEADNAKLYRVYDLQADKIKRLKAQHAATLETLREVTNALENLDDSFGYAMAQKWRDEHEALIEKARSAREGEGG